MLVQDFLEKSACSRPGKTALVSAGQRFSYGELDESANRLAHAVRALGVGRGDRIAIHLENCVESVIALFAVLKAGATFVLLNRSIKPDKLARILAHCGAKLLVTDARAVSAHGPSLEACPDLIHVICVGAVSDRCSTNVPLSGWDEVVRAHVPTRPERRSIDLDLAFLIYTSGTTGEPKGVMCDHASAVFVSGSIIEYLGNHESDVVLNVLPLSFSYGLYQVLLTFRFGGTLILESSFAYPTLTLQRLVEHRVTALPAVPTMFASLLRIDLSAFDLSNLRLVTNAAAALPPSHIREFRTRLPHVQLFSMYGSTETKRTLYMPPSLLDSKPESVGIPIPGTEVWLEDQTGRRLGAGEVGELVVRGRHVMRGYWNAPQATAARFRPGILPGERTCHSGDLFRMDSDGHFYFVARKEDIIKSRGEKVSPREVENVLHTLPGVSEACVLGVPHPLLGEAVKAVIVRSSNELTTAHVMAHCRAKLEDFMVPTIVEFRDDLPRSPSGKVRRAELA